MSGLEIDYRCANCPFNELYESETGLREQGSKCRAAKRLIKEQYGVKIPCGLGGAAVIELADPTSGEMLEEGAELLAEQEVASQLGTLALRSDEPKT